MNSPFDRSLSDSVSARSGPPGGYPGGVDQPGSDPDQGQQGDPYRGSPPGGPYYGQQPADPYPQPPGGPYYGQQPADPYAQQPAGDPYYGQQQQQQQQQQRQAWPGQPQQGRPPQGYRQHPAELQKRSGSGSGAAIVGIFLVLVGVWFLFRDQIGLDFGSLWPALAVGLGVIMVIAAFIPRRRAL